MKYLAKLEDNIVTNLLAVDDETHFKDLSLEGLYKDGNGNIAWEVSSYKDVTSETVNDLLDGEPISISVGDVWNEESSSFEMSNDEFISIYHTEEGVIADADGRVVDGVIVDE
jgi:hypothetical protein